MNKDGLRWVHVGVDDTDSRRGMCTTYVGAVLEERLRRLGSAFVGFPRLVRLNPSCPFKTRGNCAIALSFVISEELLPAVRRIVLGTVGTLAELDCKTTNPGVVFYFDRKVSEPLREFSLRVVRELVGLGEAEGLARREGVEYYRFKMGRGIIGALAAVGMPVESEFSFEFVTYRTPEHRGTKREVDAKSVIKMDAATRGETFDNLDPFSGEMRITPHTPCPVFYGIRGESAAGVFRAHQSVKTEEPVERWVVYKTNQGTDMHLQSLPAGDVSPFSSVALVGRVSRGPAAGAGGHVVIGLKSDEGLEVDCVAYEPTRSFRRVVESLVVGDLVRVCGAAKKRLGLPLTVNLEKLELLELAKIHRILPPPCGACGAKMRSLGRLGGYECEACGSVAGVAEGLQEGVRRKVEFGLYEVPPRARRHLARPLMRSTGGRVY